MSVQNILGLDMASKTGFCEIQNADSPSRIFVSGVVDFTPRRGESVGMKWLRFRAWLSQRIVEDNITVVFYEQAHHRGGAATASGAGFEAHLQSICEEYHIPYSAVHTGTIKKYWTGSGASKKDAMIAECRSRGFNPKDDNEADAIAIANYALQEVVTAVIAEDNKEE